VARLPLAPPSGSRRGPPRRASRHPPHQHHEGRSPRAPTRFSSRSKRQQTALVRHWEIPHWALSGGRVGISNSASKSERVGAHGGRGSLTPLWDPRLWRGALAGSHSLARGALRGLPLVSHWEAAPLYRARATSCGAPSYRSTSVSIKKAFPSIHPAKTTRPRLQRDVLGSNTCLQHPLCTVGCY